MPRLLRRLKLGIGPEPLRALACEVINLGLIGLQIGDIVFERPVAANGGGEPRELEERVAPFTILVKALLDDRAERIPDFLESIRVLAGEAFELSNNTARQRLAHLHDLRIVLQHFARNVERQVLAVDHAAHEAQVRGKQFRAIGDIDTPHIKLTCDCRIGSNKS